MILMKTYFYPSLFILAVVASAWAAAAPFDESQNADRQGDKRSEPSENRDAPESRLAPPDFDRDGRPPFGPGGPPPFGFGGPGGPRGPMGQNRMLVDDFDKDGDGRLNREERQAARKELQGQRQQRGLGGRRGFGGRGGFRPPRDGQPPEQGQRERDSERPEGFGPPGPFGPRGGFGPPGGFGGREDREPPKPGPKLSPVDVPPIADAPLYDSQVLRTLFLDFENADWEAELADFNNTDVEVPARLTVDGQSYPDVGVHFRGMSSFGMVGEGSKRSLNLSLDFVERKQRLYGYKTLNLLNAHEDPSFLHTVLYLHIARNYLPAPKANFVKLAINGESWGVYVNAQQFNKEFLAENFPSAKGARWKVPGSPGGDGGLRYLGEEVDEYKRRYQMKSNDGAKAWKDLIALCRTLSQTPTGELEQALGPILDLDGALWFLALDNVLVNRDGYWIRASDYNLFRDENGQFHVIPHDVNETFQPAMGPGIRRGSGGEGIELDPLVGLDDERKPLRSRLLAVPALRERYLAHVRTIAEQWLDWNKLGPVVEQYVTLIEKEIEADTRKLSSFAAFKRAVGRSAEAEPSAERRRPQLSLRDFAEKRREYLLNYLNAPSKTP